MAIAATKTKTSQTESERLKQMRDEVLEQALKTYREGLRRALTGATASDAELAKLEDSMSRLCVTAEQRETDLAVLRRDAAWARDLQGSELRESEINEFLSKSGEQKDRL